MAYKHIFMSNARRPTRQSGTGRRRRPDNAGMGMDRAQNNALPISRLRPRVRLSSGGPGRDPNPEFPPRNPISDRLRLAVSRSGYRKKAWRVAQPKNPPAPTFSLSHGPPRQPRANHPAPAPPPSP